MKFAPSMLNFDPEAAANELVGQFREMKQTKLSVKQEPAVGASKLVRTV